MVRRHLNQSNTREGQRIARQVRDLVPGSEAAWRLVLEATISARDLVGAAVEAEALQRRSEAEGTPLETTTRAVIARARGLSPRADDEPAATGLVAELTGREREFFAITSAWEAARSGRATHLHLTAPPGFGKSRLLRDACARLAASGARVVRVHGTTGDRDVPYAFAGDLASAIAQLPGATGVAPASASALVALNPTLSGQLAGAPDPAQGEEALRRRIHAMADLVQSVASEQPFVLAVDDLHWIDAPSYRLLEGLFSRLEGARVLCITAARPERRPTAEGCTALPLAPLSREQLGSLVSALGSLPDQQGWSGDFISGLHQATGGSPLLVLETLRLAIDQQILTLDQDEWRCLSETRLRSLLQAGEALRERVRALPPQQSWLLGVLATAGTPLEIKALAAHLAIHSAELDALLLPLEQHGLIARSGAGWSAAHDEIAAAARAALAPEQLVAADRAIGAYYARGSEADPERLLRATRHYAAAGDDATVQRLHRSYAIIARRRGDRRPFSEIAAELTGEDARSPRVTSLVHTLPTSWRIGLWSTARQAIAGAAALAIPLALFLAAGVRRHDEATLQRLVYADSAGVTTAVSARAAEWNGAVAAVDPVSRASTILPAVLPHRELPPAIAPDVRSVAWTEDSGDSTTLDIWIRTPAGVRRLTREVRDDLVRGWLPDGSALVGQTSRWSPRHNSDYDIAIFDTATGAARQVTHGPGQDTNPVISPDGTRVAFVRVTADDPPMFCVTSIDGGHEPECRLIGKEPVASVVGWAGLDELILVVDEPAARPLVIYDWARATHTVLLPSYVYNPLLSPDRRWVAASPRISGVPGFHDMIVPLADPARAREVSGPGKTRDPIRWWEGNPDPSRLIDRLEFSDSVREVLPGIGTRLSVRPITREGIAVPIRAPITWSSSDTLVATVDSTGEIRVRSDGVVTVMASLVGWRSVSKAVRVAGKPPVVVLDERWDTNWMQRWLPWGDPLPIVTTGPQDIRAISTRGDGVYPSMAVSRPAFSSRDGLGLEIRISTPLTYAQHQRMHARFLSDVDLPALEQADRQKAPPSNNSRQSGCGIVFPGEGRWAATRLVASGGVTENIDLGEAGAALRSGAWWTLRLQILPDGRCGVAINNKVIWLSSEPIPLDRQYRIWLGEESAGVKILHGPLQVWSGVRTDIKWVSGGK
ncbi:MAG: AAA family ATPase [Gemmatimonadota bacterium]